jgi:hypothetical protein
MPTGSMDRAIVVWRTAVTKPTPVTVATDGRW